MNREKTKMDEERGALQVYMLGAVPFDTFGLLQKRLHFDIASDRTQAALVLCEHPPLITVGRQGSRAHIQYEDIELRARQWPIQWLPRGGGCLLHVPGQLAVYPLFPLDRLRLSVRAYLDMLGATLAAVLADFSLAPALTADLHGVFVASRLAASIGVAVRDWISMYGAYLNLDPDLEVCRRVRSVAGAEITSLARERRGMVRPSLVRQRLVEHFQIRFGFDRIALFTDHPLLHLPRPAVGVLPYRMSMARGL